MRKVLAILFAVTVIATQVHSADNKWYTGDERCLPPKDDGKYSPPYDAKDHPHEYPTFHGADKPGWACSYQREGGAIVQFGNSQTPQQQWLAIWGNMDN